METDQELIRKIIKGDTLAFDQLMKMYQTDVFITVNRIINNPQISLDISQNIFIKVFQKLDTFLFKSSFKTWLMHISVNETFSWIKRNRNRLNQVPIDNDHVIAVKDKNNNPENILLDNENKKYLQTALTKLNPKYRNTVVLHYYEGYSIKDISAAMSCSEGVVKNRLFRSLRKLKSILDEYVENQS